MTSLFYCLTSTWSAWTSIPRLLVCNQMSKVVMRFWVFVSDRHLLMEVLMLIWRLNLHSAPTMETWDYKHHFGKGFEIREHFSN